MSISLGSSAISSAKLGSSQVDKIYLGTNLVWSNAAPSPPSFYSTTFGSNLMTPFFAINDGGYNSGSGQWQQWGSISGSLPSNIGAFSSVASGSGTITWDSTTKGYTFNNKYIYWTGSASPNYGAWLPSNVPAGTNWNEQVLALFWQGTIPVGAELADNYIASAGENNQSLYYGWDLIWNTQSVQWVGGNTSNHGGGDIKYFSGSFTPGQKYNVMYVMSNYGGNHYTNIYYAKVNSNGTSEPITGSTNGVYNFSGDAYNSVVYFYDAASGNTNAKVGKGTLSAGTAGTVNSASIHSFMMYAGQADSAPEDWFLNGYAQVASASVGATSYIQQIFNTASLTF
jgi:hypothetical protein